MMPTSTKNPPVSLEQKNYDMRIIAGKLAYKKELRHLMCITPSWKWLNYNYQHWRPIGIVDVKKTIFKNVVEAVPTKNQNILFNHQPFEKIPGMDHRYIYKETIGPNCFFGYMLLPLNNGKYFYIEYSC